jgi:hypothetical protein
MNILDNLLLESEAAQEYSNDPLMYEEIITESMPYDEYFDDDGTKDGLDETLYSDEDIIIEKEPDEGAEDSLAEPRYDETVVDVDTSYYQETDHARTTESYLGQDYADSSVQNTKSSQTSEVY